MIEHLFGDRTFFNCHIDSGTTPLKRKQKMEDDDMKKGNLTLLASIIFIALLTMGVGAGTMAWLNDTETAQITITVATKDLQIARPMGHDLRLYRYGVR